MGSIPLISMARSDESSDLTTSTPVNYEPEVDTTSNRLLRNIIITILAILVVVIATSLFLKLGRKGKIK